MPKAPSSVLWLAVLGIGFALGLIHILRVAQVDAHGISIVASKPVTWDFTNLWYGGRLALKGQVHTLFDVEAYRAGLRSLFAPYIENSEWSYPPTLLLVGAPLALLPLYPSYAVWTFGTLGLLVLALRQAGFRWPACALACISPAALNNVAHGQNGALIAALLIGGLLAAQRRPVLAGLLFGLLTVKPQFGVLVPVCLVAGGHWRTVFWSVCFALLLVVLSLLCFGTSAWTGFFATTQPLMKSILEAPFGQGYQANAITVFASVREFGGSLSTAYVTQAIAALVSAAIVWRLWKNSNCPAGLKTAATAALTLLVTPYGYSYDLVLLACSVLIVRNSTDSRYDPILGVLWLWPSLVNFVNAHGAPLSPLVLAVATWTSLRVLRSQVAVEPGPHLNSANHTQKTHSQKA